MTENDLVFLAPENLNDSDTGGGRMTGNVIPDGQENNLFQDVGPGARITGRVFLREAFAANRANDASLFLDAHVLLTEIPADPAISVTLFSIGDEAASRAEAQDYIERYLARGGYWPAMLYGNHLNGQAVLQLVCLENVETPNVGQTLVLIQDEGASNEIEQYVRATKVSSVVRTFVDSQGEFTRQVVTVEISDALRYDFAGVDPTRYTSTGGRTKIRDTVVASAAHYYSARPLVAAAQATERTLYVDSLYTQLVPSAQTETPLSNLNAASDANPLVISGNQVVLTTSAVLGPNAQIYLGIGITAGSLSIATATGMLADDGHGSLLSGLTTVATIDYGQGTAVGVTGGPTYSGSKTCTWTPAGAPSASTMSAAIAVTAESRGTNYTLELSPIPASGTLRVDYLSGGKWYRLQDRGDGALVGASTAYGAGSVSFTSGSARVTLGALPDIGSAVLLFWANAPDATNRGGSALAAPKFIASLVHDNVVPGTLTLAWETNSVAQTAAVAIDGTLSGDATGTLDAAEGGIDIFPTLLPAPGTIMTASYQYGGPHIVDFANPARETNQHLRLTLPDLNAVAGSVKVTWNVVLPDELTGDLPPEMQIIGSIDPQRMAYDDGLGAFSSTSSAPGTIDYANSIIDFLPDVNIAVLWPVYWLRKIGTDANGNPVYRNMFRGLTYKTFTARFPSDGTGHVTVRYRIASDTNGGSVTDEEITLSVLTLDVTKDYAEAVVSNSLSFLCGGRNYVDRSGSLYYGIDPATGAGTLGGTLDVGSGRCALTDWAGNVAPAQSLRTLLTQLNVAITDETVFRCALAPIRPGSFSVLATPVLPGAAQINLTADLAGVIYSAGVADGKIDLQTSVVRIRWGGWINDADVTADQKLEPWYDINARVDFNGTLKIFKPRPVYSNTVRYYATGYSYLPLSADLIGLDPVRLPSDGRVQCLKKGDVAIVTHSTEHSVATPVAGGTVDTELVGVARVRVYDSTGAAVQTDRYSLAQDTGIVTWASPLDLSAYTGPFDVKAWIEDAAMITDADLSGLITLNMALTHDYPPGALVSSALMHGDLYARVGAIFMQQAWTNVWSDERIGSPTLAQYNALQHPPVLTNLGSWRERWLLLFSESTTSFRVIGETLGDITDSLGGAGYHDTSHDLAPINPLTGTPYFTLPWQGWGSGRVIGNCLRLNFTEPANFPFWLAMTIQPSAPAEGLDQFRLLLRGGVDA